MDETALRSFFERCYVINLDRRPDRWDSFPQRCPKAKWPFVEPVRFRARDGRTLPWPPWWKAGGGAWGVYRSTLSILEECLMDNVRSVLILEDDALPCDNFQNEVGAFLSALPQDWQMVYLGGQINHYNLGQHPPTKVNERVIKPWSVNRLHAYGMTHDGMKIVYKHLTAMNWQPKHHIDHRIEMLQRANGIKFYAPTDWLVGQGQGRSDISAHELPVRFWGKNPTKPRKQPQKLPVVAAVVGPYRGGTSAVAGAMHNLGIIMGHQFFSGGRDASPKGCFEAKRLFDICLQCYPEPSFESLLTKEDRTKLLHGWLLGRAREESVIGAKHPKFCLMVPEITEAWPDCKFVVVHRPVEESVASLTKLKWWSNVQNQESLIRRFVETRDKDLESVPAERQLHLDFAFVLEDPRPAMEKIAEFVQIEPLEVQYQAAVDHLDPSLKHYGACYADIGEPQGAVCTHTEERRDDAACADACQHA